MCCEKDERIAELELHVEMMQMMFEADIERIERKILKAIAALDDGRYDKAERILWKIVE